MLAPLAAVFFSLRQTAVYQASATVLLGQQNLAASVIASPSQTAGFSASTQTYLARVPEVAQVAIDSLHLRNRSAGTLLGESSVATESDGDILSFTVNDRNPVLAAQLATAYARAYIVYRRRLDTAAIESARRQIGTYLRHLEDQGKSSSSLYANLAEKEQELGTMSALQGANSSLLETPSVGAQIWPRPKRDALIGLVLGLVVGVGLAFLREALDTRVRSAAEISERLGLPLLARLPAPPRELAAQHRLVMLAEPTSVQAEAFRMLRTNLELVCVDRGVRTLMVSSAVEQEGKTTTAANLALALARSGQHVVLVDLDLRRPLLDKFFDLRGRPGLTQVVLHRGTLDEALVRVPVTAPTPLLNGNSRRVAGQNGDGRLFVLGSGPLPPDPGEFIATESLGDLLDELGDRADIVVIDAPPLLHVGDALVLSARADALIVVAKLERLRRPMLGEMRRILEPMPTLKLGFVVTGAQSEDGYGYGYGYYSSYHRPKTPTEEPAR